MKKLIITLLLLFCITSVFEAQVKSQIVYKNRSGVLTLNPSYVSPLPTVDVGNNGYTTKSSSFNASVTADTLALDVSTYDNVMIAYNYDETEVGNSVSSVTVFQVSADSANWYNYDVLLSDAGTDAPVTSISVSADTTDVLYLPPGFTAQYLRAITTATNTDADDLLSFTLTIFWKE